MTSPRLLLACLVPLLAACGGGSEDVPPAAQPATTAEATTAEPQARVTYEYHDEYGHGHCYVTEVAAAEEVVVCIAPTDRGARIACFTREEAQGSRNAKGLLRVNRGGEVTAQEEWPAECGEALAVVDPNAGAATNGGGY